MMQPSETKSTTDTSPRPGNPLRWLLPIAIALPTLITWIYFDLLHGANPRLQQIAYGLGKTLQFALPLWAAWRVWPAGRVTTAEPGAGARPRLSGWGSGWERLTPRKSGLLLGAAFGLGVCVLLVFAFQFLIAGTSLEQTLRETAREKISSLGIQSGLLFVAVGVFYAAIHSLLEEYYWRWFVFGSGEKIWGTTRAIVISSLGFMAHHVLLLGHFLGYGDWRTYLLSLAIAIGGAFWAWLYKRTENLTASWLSHAIVDAGIFGFGYWLLFN
ncbi:MAG: lysostaphin resistance A-like protein [Planctomycetota bacterium]